MPVLLAFIYALLIFLLLRFYSHKQNELEYEKVELAERLNVLKNETFRQASRLSALRANILRYHKLKDIVEALNLRLDLESITESLACASFSQISRERGTCILYLIDKQLDLQIHKAKKEHPEEVIREKKGDVFDLWVLRHLTPLRIEDIHRDFRFDPVKDKGGEERQVRSLIISPLMSEHRFLGTLRLDHPQTGFFTQDDLRVLVAISDLGAVALENCELFHRVQELARRDTLTSLFTKGYFRERLKEEIRRCMRKEGCFSLLIADVDHFKDYNDRFGHTAGDIVLKRIAQTLRDSLEATSPVLARFGGEEFLALLPATDKTSAKKAAQKLRASIEKEKIILRRRQTGVTVSIGVATFPEDAKDDEGLIQKADTAMYLAKQKGRNRVA